MWSRASMRRRTSGIVIVVRVVGLRRRATGRVQARLHGAHERPVSLDAYRVDRLATVLLCCLQSSGR